MPQLVRQLSRAALLVVTQKYKLLWAPVFQAAATRDEIELLSSRLLQQGMRLLYWSILSQSLNASARKWHRWCPLSFHWMVPVNGPVQLQGLQMWVNLWLWSELEGVLLFYFKWRIIVGFCGTAVWISHNNMHIPSLLNLCPITLLPTSLGHHRVPGCILSATHQLPTSYLFYTW